MIGDTGIGFPEAVDFRHAQSLGLQVVCMLTEQLQGTIALDRHAGTRFTLTFPVRQATSLSAAGWPLTPVIVHRAHAVLVLLLAFVRSVVREDICKGIEGLGVDVDALKPLAAQIGINPEQSVAVHPAEERNPYQEGRANGLSLPAYNGMSAAVRSRCQAALPRRISELLARLKYRCMVWSQVKPTPPCTCMPSAVTRVYVSLP
jgi:hypothetical protein